MKLKRLRRVRLVLAREGCVQDCLPPAAECLCHNAGICCCVLHGLSKRRLIRSMAGRPDDGPGPRWVSCVTNKQGGPKTALMHGAGL